MWDMFQSLYQGLRKHSLQANGWYADVSLHSGKVVRAHAEALGAAWCGIEVGAGYVADGAWCTNAHHRVRHEVGYLSENFDVPAWKVRALHTHSNARVATPTPRALLTHTCQRDGGAGVGRRVLASP